MDLAQLVIAVVTVIAGIGVQTWLIIKYLIDRMDSKLETERKERLKDVNSLYDKITEFHSTHVRRDDHNRHVDNMERKITEVVVKVEQMGINLNTRLDSLISMFVTSKGGKND